MSWNRDDLWTWIVQGRSILKRKSPDENDIIKDLSQLFVADDHILQRNVWSSQCLVGLLSWIPHICIWRTLARDFALFSKKSNRLCHVLCSNISLSNLRDESTLELKLIRAPPRFWNNHAHIFKLLEGGQQYLHIQTVLITSSSLQAQTSSKSPARGVRLRSWGHALGAWVVLETQLEH